MADKRCLSIPNCLGYFSMGVTKHCDQGKLIKRKILLGAPAQSSGELTSMTIMVASVVAGRLE